MRIIFRSLSIGPVDQDLESKSTLLPSFINAIMDPEIKVMHVVTPHKLQPERSLTVRLSSKYNRKHPPADVYEHPAFSDYGLGPSKNSVSTTEGVINPINVVWRNRIADNPRLFNATKFRIHAVETVENNNVQMSLGVTDYKDFLGTNWAPYAQQLQLKGIEHYGDSQVFLSDALGVGASVITKDEFLMFLCRSKHCAEAPGTWDVPGGHAEPKEIVGDVPLQEIDLKSMDCTKVVHEIFDSILREVTDEVNIPREHLTPPLYTGTHRNMTSSGRPSVAFEIRCALSREEVLNLYNIGSQPEADESTQILFIPRKDIPTLDTQDKKLWQKMAPSAKGNLTVFCLAHELREF